MNVPAAPVDRVCKPVRRELTIRCLESVDARSPPRAIYRGNLYRGRML
jgi:hypothetical protein